MLGGNDGIRGHAGSEMYGGTSLILRPESNQYLDAVGAPAAQLGGGRDVLLEPRGELRKVQEDVAG